MAYNMMVLGFTQTDLCVHSRPAAQLVNVGVQQKECA